MTLGARMSGKTDHSSNPDGSYFKKIPDFDGFDERFFPGKT
jgi:hypothetical protein